MRIDRFIYVSPAAYGQLPVQQRHAVARLIGRVAHADETHPPETIVLLGPGRWGTTAPSLGVPIAFSIGLSTLIAMLLTNDLPTALTTMAQRMATGADAFVLLAIPFFILAGQIMNRGGIARRIIAFARAAVGMFPGGLAFVNIMSAMLFGALSGSAVAAASRNAKSKSFEMARLCALATSS